MAGKTRPMSQIKQLLRLHQQGKAKKEIARILGISKNTVKSYLHKYGSSGYNIDDLLELDDPVLESKFHLGNPSYKEHRYEFLKKQMDYYVQELKRNGVTRLILWEEYKESNPNGYSFSQFCYHLHQHQKASKPTAVLHHEPSDKLFIDFAGKQLSYVDIQTGEIIKCQVFVACLPYSDYAFAMAVKTQGVEDFIYAISCCLSYLGGVPRAIVPDNLKSAVIKSDRYEPELNVALDDLANHYGTTIVPARVRSPKDKALLETRKHHELSLSEGLKLLLQNEYQSRKNNRFERLKKNAGFRYQATIEEIYIDAARGVDKEMLATLATGAYMENGESVLITGASGCGKSFLASALGQQACMQGKKVAYYNLQKLLMRTKMARLEGSIHKMFTKLSKTDLLIIDDFGLTRLDQQQRMDIMEIIEDRHARNSLIITSQLPVVNWYDIIGDDTIADAILDRLVHTAYRIELNGESLRKKR